ncbi:MAG: lysophospholipid acyltransferase family protein [Bacillota bacterium]
MIRTYLWFAAGWTLLVLTCPMLWRVKYLDKLGRSAERDRLVDRMTALISRLLFSLTASKLKIVGAENIPKEGPVLFVSNHQGHMDSVIIHAFIDKPKGFVSIVEVLNIPILSTWMKYMRCVFMDRDDARQSLACIYQGIDYLKQGRSMVVFPEGKLSDWGPTGVFNRGWLKLATKTGVPIVPITINGSYKVLSKDGSNVQSATVECVISKPIPTVNLKKEDEGKFIESLRTIILSNL